MCIVADPPTFILMFRETDPRHPDFAPVRDWVKHGPGKFVLGGTTYNRQLAAVPSVLGFLLELQKIGKIVREDPTEVDAHEAALKVLEPSTSFDDPHLVALVRVSGCRLICVNDLKAHRFLKERSFYSKICARPKLYTSQGHTRLLCKDHIVPCCQ